MKRIHYFLSVLIAGLTWSCNSGDDPSAAITDPGKNVAGYAEGTYRVVSVISGKAGGSSQSAGTMNGSGMVTLTRINDSTVAYNNQTELTVVATGEKIPLNVPSANCRVKYEAYGSTSRIRLVSGNSSYGYLSTRAEMLFEVRGVVDAKGMNKYDVTTQYQR